MDFSSYDKYILDLTSSKVKNLINIYKTTIKDKYLKIDKITTETNTFPNSKIVELLKENKSFVAGVNVFEKKKTDFYIVANNGIFLPIQINKDIVIEDYENLNKELFEKGYHNVLQLSLKTKKEIQENEQIRIKYAINKDDDASKIAKSISSLSRDIKIHTREESFFKMKDFNDIDLAFILSKCNALSREIYEKINLFDIENTEALPILKETGFNNLRLLSQYQEYIKNLNSKLTLDLSKSKLYNFVSFEKLVFNEIPFDIEFLKENPFLKVTFNESKLLQILNNDNFEYAKVVPNKNVKIHKPLKNIEEYEEFLKIEEFIKKQSHKKIDMNINHIPTLDEILNKEFQMIK